MNISSIIRNKEIIIAVGSGGVGKTTLSAAIAYKAARLGKRCIVCTIDPAKRLADVLNIQMKPNQISRVQVDDQCYFNAMMLDNKKTFDHLIKRLSPSVKKQEKMLNNKIYKAVAKTFARISEYMAMEQLFDLYQSEQYDLIILDTPPSKHTIDFLLRPNILLNFIDQNVIGWIIKPYVWATKLGFDFFLNKASRVFKSFSEFLGANFMLELAELLVLFEELIIKFRGRAEKIGDLISSDQASFIVITRPQKNPIREARFLIDKLKENDLSFDKCVINKVLPTDIFEYSNKEFKDCVRLCKEWDKKLFTSSFKFLVGNYNLLHKRLKEEKIVLGELADTIGSDQLRLVDQLSGNVNKVGDLSLLADQL